MSSTQTAYGKINLGLRIVGRRPDGYHDIETVFHAIGWSDEITLRRTDAGISMRSSTSELREDSDNICVRTAILFKERTGWGDGVHIDLEKSIPIGAGLGGGSSDAAAVLRGMQEVSGIELSHDQQLEIARSLGADVPFFLSQGTAFAEGIGDRLTPLAMVMPYVILCIYPGISISTSWAYASLSGPFPLSSISLKDVTRDWKGVFSSTQARGSLYNDFETSVFKKEPLVGHIKSLLYEEGADFSLLSGSGSSVYAMTLTEGQAHHFAEKIISHYPELPIRFHITTASVSESTHCKNCD